jgi:hypothetical protein
VRSRRSSTAASARLPPTMSSPTTASSCRAPLSDSGGRPRPAGVREVAVGPWQRTRLVSSHRRQTRSRAIRARHRRQGWDADRLCTRGAVPAVSNEVPPARRESHEVLGQLTRAMTWRRRRASAGAPLRTLVHVAPPGLEWCPVLTSVGLRPGNRTRGTWSASRPPRGMSRHRRTGRDGR